MRVRHKLNKAAGMSSLKGAAPGHKQLILQGQKQTATRHPCMPFVAPYVTASMHTSSILASIHTTSITIVPEQGEADRLTTTFANAQGGGGTTSRSQSTRLRRCGKEHTLIYHVHVNHAKIYLRHHLAVRCLACHSADVAAHRAKQNHWQSADI